MSDDDAIPDISPMLFILTSTPPVVPRMRVVRDVHGHDTTYSGEPDIKPCAHPEYALDDEWQIVRCAECQERLDPYALLRHHAHYWEQMMRDRDATDEARKILRVEQLRAMIERKDCPTELRQEVRKVTLWGNARFASLAILNALYLKVSETLRSKREARRRQRRETA